MSMTSSKSIVRNSVCAGITLLLSVIFISSTGAIADKSNDAAALHEVAAAFESWMQEGNANYIELANPDAIEVRFNSLDQIFNDFQALDNDSLSNDEIALSRTMEELIFAERSRFIFKTNLIPFGPTWGADLWLRGKCDGSQLMSEEHAGEYLNFLRDQTVYLSNMHARLKEGVAQNILPPLVTVQDLPDRFSFLGSADGRELIRGPLHTLPDNISLSRRNKLWRRLRTEIEPSLFEELAELENYVRETYLPACRTSIAASSHPMGIEYYFYSLRTYAETADDPKDLHARGILEVERIQREATLAIDPQFYRRNKQPPAPDAFKNVLQEVVANPDYQYQDGETLLRDARDVSKRIDEWLPVFFHDLPRLPFAVRATPPTSGQVDAAGYKLGDLEYGFPSYVYFDTQDLNRHATWKVISRVLHEGSPGHHLQFALANEMESSYTFQKYAWFAGFGEGWAMYCEWLGQAMNLYGDPVDNFGRLTAELHRACRLVVDTGIHSQDWTREEAVEYMKMNSALDDHSIEVDVNRMIAHPGQACSYTINGLRMRKLRGDAERELGPNFDIRDFHHAVIGAGTVPMDIAELRVRNWIEKTKTEAAAAASPEPAKH